MTTKPPPGRTPATEAARQARLEREAAALRANLHRRKAQARAVPPQTLPPQTVAPQTVADTVAPAPVDDPADPEHG